MSLAAGSKLGPYEILGPIGAEGMGEVYKARDPRLGREVDLPSGKPRPITDRGYGLDRNGISPDGPWAAAWGDWTEDLYLIPTAGGEPRSVPNTKDVDFVRFSPDGKSFYGVVTGGIPAKVVRIDVATGRREMLEEHGPAERSGIIGVGPAFRTPDGKNYAYGYGKAATSDLYLIEGLK